MMVSTADSMANDAAAITRIALQVTGRVQGVGFRPAVWRLARELGFSGDVRNDAQGVRIRLCGTVSAVAAFKTRLIAEQPPLARIETIEVTPCDEPLPDGFRIIDSIGGAARTQIAPDTAICSGCTAETLDPFARRYRYPFTNCTNCGPRLTILRQIPYDRAQTAMAEFPMCSDCAAEYANPADRRFHAEPIACYVCGPLARLIRLDGRATSYDQHSMLDDVDAAGSLVQKGMIVAIKGLGGYQLACDATNADSVARLRSVKQRETKPFALMARDLAVIQRFCSVSDEEAAVLSSPEAPIVLLKLRIDGERLPASVAPGTDRLGFMLPTTPIHLLMLQRMTRPVVMTSGNRADEPQVIDDSELAERLGGIAEYALIHNRPIENRVDDSVVRVDPDGMRILRRARGFAPAALRLPRGFAAAPPLTALGGELKATFCLLRDGEAILSQHQGDMENVATFDDYQRNLALFNAIYDHVPTAFVADGHPEYLISKWGRETAKAAALPLIEVQHHHAHMAACLVENGYALDGAEVLGITLDGLGWGVDGTFWGGEFLIGDYRGFVRAGSFKPVAMPGGVSAIREPWRNLHAHLMAEMGWAAFAMNFGELALAEQLRAKPLSQINDMIRRGLNSPTASSCGRLFDAVAAAVGLCFDRQGHEAEAAMALEAVIDHRALIDEGAELAYPFSIPMLPGSRLPYIEPLAMWNAILGDLILKTPRGVISARFHRGLARAIVRMAVQLARRDSAEGAAFTTVALSGGCFQNAILHSLVRDGLGIEGFTVLSHTRVPANDGGLALGQAAIAAASLIADQTKAKG